MHSGTPFRGEERYPMLICSVYLLVDCEAIYDGNHPWHVYHSHGNLHAACSCHLGSTIVHVPSTLRQLSVDLELVISFLYLIESFDMVPFN